MLSSGSDVAVGITAAQTAVLMITRGQLTISSQSLDIGVFANVTGTGFRIQENSTFRAPGFADIGVAGRARSRSAAARRPRSAAKRSSGRCWQQRHDSRPRPGHHVHGRVGLGVGNAGRACSTWTSARPRRSAASSSETPGLQRHAADRRFRCQHDRDRGRHHGRQRRHRHAQRRVREQYADQHRRRQHRGAARLDGHGDRGGTSTWNQSGGSIFVGGTTAGTGGIGTLNVSGTLNVTGTGNGVIVRGTGTVNLSGGALIRRTSPVTRAARSTSLVAP